MIVTTLGIFTFQCFVFGRIGSTANPPIHPGIVGIVCALLALPWFSLLLLAYIKVKHGKMIQTTGLWIISILTCLLSATPLNLIGDEEKLFPLMILLAFLSVCCLVCLIPVAITFKRRLNGMK
jgi:hypothetical protein